MKIYFNLPVDYYECPTCKKHLKSFTAWNNHQRKKHGTFRCYHCLQTCKSVYNLDWHLRIYHKSV